MKQVNVLISTYNGEKYIAQQIDSLLNQTYPNIRIYVRDDGSIDSTLRILEAYWKADKIVLIKGENIRYGRSFMKLLEISDDGDYWCFCDQDDVWLPEKVEWAVRWMESQDRRIPLLFHSAYHMVNADNTKVFSSGVPPQYQFCFRRAITDCLYQGFSITLNGALRNLMLKADLNAISSHDWWATILVEEFGKAYFDERIASRHRRLDSSMSSMSLSARLKWLRNTLRSGNEDIKSSTSEFVRIFSDGADSKDLKIAKWFTHDRYCLSDSFKKAFYPGRWRSSLTSEITIRFLMFLGKI